MGIGEQRGSADGVDAIRALASAIREDGAFDFSAIVAAFGETFGFAKAMFYRPLPANDGYAIEFAFGDGFVRSEMETFLDETRERGRRIIAYDPLRPAPEQRNQVVSVARTIGFTEDGIRLFRRMGIDPTTYDQTRALVCDGELLLAWIGGARAEPFTPAETAEFQRLLGPLRSAFAIDRRLRDASIAHAGLVAAMNVISSPAFLATETGAVDHANELGRLQLDRAPSETREAIARTIARGPLAGKVTKVDIVGGATRWLVIMEDVRGRAALSAKLERVAHAWKLTTRQAEVLAHIARGDANKTIAHRLGCTEANVEAIATAVFKKAHVEGRMALMAKLLELG